MSTYTPTHLERWKRPSCYSGATWPNYYGSGFGQSRDSGALERSNFAVALAAIKALPAFNAADEEQDSRIVVRENHWAVGWIEWIAIHQDDAEALRLCDSLVAKVENYPILDEEHFSQVEQDDANETWRNCFNDKERVAYMREHRRQFDTFRFADLLACARGKYFLGYASELLR